MQSFPGVMNPEARADGTPTLDPAVGLDEDALPSAVRHRRHRFPARDKVVKVRYDERELAVLAAAAGRAGLTVAGFLAGAGLSAAGQGPPPSQVADRELLGELLRLRLDIRRYAVNVNQAVAALHSTGDAPVRLSRAVAGADRAVARVDAATRRVAGRRGVAGA